VALFGEKDYQQLTLITKMARDLDFPLSVVGVPTVREPDGLALSSRNVYLSEADRERAVALSRALRAGAAVSA
jgi:pantoate--beta-alanine ligase